MVGSRELLSRPVLEVAPVLLGAVLSHGEVSVRVTEVEAYAGESDPGSHAFRGPTPRTSVMFGPAGHAYVYFTYGMHWCVNVVVGADGTASAVLLRAGEVLRGLDVARERRPGSSDRDLCRGPARLCKALGITGALTGSDVLGGGPLQLELSPAAGVVRTGPRVGLSAGGEVPWRFWLDGEPTVSVWRAGAPRRRRSA